MIECGKNSKKMKGKESKIKLYENVHNVDVDKNFIEDGSAHG